MWLQMVTVISTFAGCGGSSLGYKWAGFKELLAIEWEDNAAETFKLNFPEVPIWQRDICLVTGQEILDFCNIKSGELDVFDGSPPCQGFSTAGKRKVTDNRNDLFKEYVRLVNDLQPKVFIMENVSGMIKGKMKGKFIEIITMLKSLNYQVKCKLLNAMWYDVPQSRERLIFIGVRNDLKLQPIFPKPNKSFITVREALKDCIISENERKEADITKRSIYKYWLQIKEGENHFKRFSLYKINRNKSSPTLTKTGGAGQASLVHYSEPRYLVENELKRISSFPDTFKMIGKLSDKYARMGNAVMPKFMQAIAETIKKEILS